MVIEVRERSVSPVKTSLKEQRSPENLSSRKTEKSLDYSVQKPETGKIQPASPSKLFPSHSPQNFILNPNFGDLRSSGKLICEKLSMDW